jgi:predicted type IV restriction endonuclease
MPLNETLARQRLQALLDEYHKLSDDERRQMSEASVVRQFIDRLLSEVLGWPITNPARYKYEMHTQAGRPDMTLIPEQGGTIFVEAKRFGIIKELEQARYTVQGVITPGQMALPGMAVDRTPEEQQAINYAFANGGTWAILTNFERLRLFNARRDWLVLSFERPGAYLSDFDLLWQLAYDNVLKGSLDTLSNQRYARDIDTAYLTFINEWRLKLAQDIIKGRAQNAWAFRPDGSIDLPALRSVVQRYLDRLVVARFAEDWLVIDPGTLGEFAKLRRGNRYSFPMDAFLDNFFRKFDEQHNSALFAKALVDEAIFSDDALLPLIDKLYEVRYRSMPADILGNTYEQYLGKALVLTNGTVEARDNLETRKKQGSYYTPQVIVQYIVDNSLGRYLYGTADGKPDGEPLPGETRKTARDILDLRCLDSACGSGSFLIYAYKVLAGFYEGELLRLRGELDARIQKLAADFTEITTDDRIANQRLENEIARISNYPRLILENHLYGVDLDPQAAEIATVNLIMRAMEGRFREKRLPLILGQSVKVGNGLVGKVPHPPANSPHLPDPLATTSPSGRLRTGEGEEYRVAVAELVRLRNLLRTDPDKGKPQAPSTRDRYGSMSLEDALQIANPTARLEALEAIANRINNPAAAPAEREAEAAHETYYELLAKTRALADKLDEEVNYPSPHSPHAPAHLSRSQPSPSDGEGGQKGRPFFSDLGRVRPFHWGIEFPEVFYNDDGTPKENGGFDIIFGNPPWEILKPDLREFYAQFDERIESRFTRAQAEARIKELDAEDPRRRALFEEQTATVEATAAYARACGDYTRQGTGDTATHKLFLERMYGLLRNGGRLGYVVPSGIYTDLGTKPLREMLLNEGNIQYLFSFSNERFFFPGVHHSFKFVLLGAQKGPQTDGFWAAFRFNPRVAVAPDDLPAFLGNRDNLIYVGRESLERFSPDSLSVMEFQSKQDYEIAEKIYNGWPLLGDTLDNNWNCRLHREFDFANDRRLLNQKAEGIPFYEGKMIHQYNAFYAPPEFWISDKHIVQLSHELQEQIGSYRVTHRRIARTTDERTLISAIVPPNSACENNATVVLIQNDDNEASKLYVCAMFNSFVLDYLIRYKVATTLNMFYMQSLPIPRLTAGNPYFDAIVPLAARLTCTRAEYAELWRAVMGTEWETPHPPANLPHPPAPSPSNGEGETPGEGERNAPVIDPVERQRLRDQIDALVAHLYGLTREEFDHILGTFPLVFPDSEAGRARRAAVLAAYDAVGKESTSPPDPLSTRGEGEGT